MSLTTKKETVYMITARAVNVNQAADTVIAESPMYSYPVVNIGFSLTVTTAISTGNVYLFIRKRDNRLYPIINNISSTGTGSLGAIDIGERVGVAVGTLDSSGVFNIIITGEVSA